MSQNPEWASLDQAEKVLSAATLLICIELVLFKFLPDLSTALIQKSASPLADFGAFERMYLTPNSVHFARFLGNRILYDIARLVGSVTHYGDIRLHPLRIAAGLVTPIYAWIGAYLAMRGEGGYSWRNFMAPYAVAVIFSLYAFYPGDMPGFAFLSLSLFYLLQERLGASLLCMLVTGLFRESSLHAVFFVAVWAVCSRTMSLRNRIMWLLVFALTFGMEYAAIRHVFPGPMSSAGEIILNPSRLFLDTGMRSLTSVCSLSLALIYPIACLIKLDGADSGGWRRRFFQLNCYAFPLWVVFYRMLNGNMSEFRLLLPVLIPCIYGIASTGRTTSSAKVG